MEVLKRFDMQESNSIVPRFKACRDDGITVDETHYKHSGQLNVSHCYVQWRSQTSTSVGATYNNK